MQVERCVCNHSGDSRGDAATVAHGAGEADGGQHHAARPRQEYRGATGRSQRATRPGGAGASAAGESHRRSRSRKPPRPCRSGRSGPRRNSRPVRRRQQISIPKSRWYFRATPSTASRARCSTACASSTGPRATCAAATNKWKPPRAIWPPSLQRTPTEAEVAAKLGMDVERWRNMMLDLRNVGLISASTRSNEHEDLPAPDFPSKPETHPDSICAREQLRQRPGRCDEDPSGALSESGPAVLHQ